MANDELKLSRQQRRQLEREKAKENKRLGIKPNASDNEKINVTKAELKRLVDYEVSKRIGNSELMQKTEMEKACEEYINSHLEDERVRIFKQVTYEQYYMLGFVLNSLYGFGSKRIKDTWDEITRLWNGMYEEDANPNFDYVKFIVDAKTDNYLKPLLEKVQNKESEEQQNG